MDYGLLRHLFVVATSGGLHVLMLDKFCGCRMRTVSLTLTFFSINFLFLKHE